MSPDDSSESRICLSRFVPGFPLSRNLQRCFCQAARRSLIEAEYEAKQEIEENEEAGGCRKRM